jgi:hypothetical protein
MQKKEIKTPPTPAEVQPPLSRAQHAASSGWQRQNSASFTPKRFAMAETLSLRGELTGERTQEAAGDGCLVLRTLNGCEMSSMLCTDAFLCKVASNRSACTLSVASHS